MDNKSENRVSMGTAIAIITGIVALVAAMFAAGFWLLSNNSPIAPNSAIVEQSATDENTATSPTAPDEPVRTVAEEPPTPLNTADWLTVVGTDTFAAITIPPTWSWYEEPFDEWQGPGFLRVEGSGTNSENISIMVWESTLADFNMHLIGTSFSAPFTFSDGEIGLMYEHAEDEEFFGSISWLRTDVGVLATLSLDGGREIFTENEGLILEIVGSLQGTWENLPTENHVQGDSQPTTTAETPAASPQDLAAEIIGLWAELMHTEMGDVITFWEFLPDGRYNTDIYSELVGSLLQPGTELGRFSVLGNTITITDGNGQVGVFENVRIVDDMLILGNANRPLSRVVIPEDFEPQTPQSESIVEDLRLSPTHGTNSEIPHHAFNLVLQHLEEAERLLGLAIEDRENFYHILGNQAGANMFRMAQHQFNLAIRVLNSPLSFTSAPWSANTPLYNYVRERLAWAIRAERG